MNEERLRRKLTDTIKKEISNAMKLHHQKRGHDQKQRTAQKQSDSMQNYWRTIPKKSEGE